MKVRLLLFAQYREWAGLDQLEFDLPARATAADLMHRVRAEPGMARLPAVPAIAVNQVYAPLSALLSDGDEIALIPPVAGG
ncbi:MAG: MoaD/ThiS family protein [Longimicrobiales bacterium]